MNKTELLTTTVIAAEMLEVNMKEVSDRIEGSLNLYRLKLIDLKRSGLIQDRCINFH